MGGKVVIFYPISEITMMWWAALFTNYGNSAGLREISYSVLFCIKGCRLCDFSSQQNIITI